MMVRQAHVQIRTADNGILAPERTGLSETIQAADFSVVVAGQRTSHVVVRSGIPSFVLTDYVGEIRKLFPGSVVSLVLTESPGETTIACGEDERIIVFGAAAAAATLQRKWLWDESPAIAVRIRPADVTIRVDPVYDGHGWSVREVDEPFHDDSVR